MKKLIALLLALVMENSPLLRAWLLDCGYRGMLWGDETLANDRIGLEKAAIRILKLVLQLKKG